MNIPHTELNIRIFFYRNVCICTKLLMCKMSCQFTLRIINIPNRACAKGSNFTFRGLLRSKDRSSRNNRVLVSLRIHCREARCEGSDDKKAGEPRDYLWTALRRLIIPERKKAEYTHVPTLQLIIISPGQVYHTRYLFTGGIRPEQLRANDIQPSPFYDASYTYTDAFSTVSVTSSVTLRGV